DRVTASFADDLPGTEAIEGSNVDQAVSAAVTAAKKLIDERLQRHQHPVTGLWQPASDGGNLLRTQGTQDLVFDTPGLEGERLIRGARSPRAAIVRGSELLKRR